MPLYKKSICFVLSLAVIHILFICTNRYVNKNYSLLSRQEKTVNEIKSLPPVLVMGDSHIGMGIDTSLLTKTLSLAFNGENNAFSYYRMKNLFEVKKKRPKLLIMPLTPFTLAESTQRMQKNNEFYLQFSDVEEYDRISGSGYQWRKKKIYYTLFPYLDLWKKIILKDMAKFRNEKNVRLSDKSDLEKEYESRNFVFRLSPFNLLKFYSSTGLYYAGKTAELCKKHNITLVYLKIPVSAPFYYEMIRQGGGHYFSNHPLSELSASYRNVVILDYNKIFLKNENYFADTHHLNREGSEKFTEILVPVIDSLLAESGMR